MPRPPNSPDVVLLHLGVKLFGRQIARVRIERGQHALDGGADQLLLVRRIDIFGADAVEDLAEQREVGVDLAVGSRHIRDVDGGFGSGGLFLRHERNAAAEEKHERHCSGANSRKAHRPFIHSVSGS